MDADAPEQEVTDPENDPQDGAPADVLPSVDEGQVTPTSAHMADSSSPISPDLGDADAIDSINTNVEQVPAAGDQQLHDGMVPDGSANTPTDDDTGTNEEESRAEAPYTELVEQAPAQPEQDEQMEQEQVDALEYVVQLPEEGADAMEPEGTAVEDGQEPPPDETEVQPAVEATGASMLMVRPSFHENVMDAESIQSMTPKPKLEGTLLEVAEKDSTYEVSQALCSQSAPATPCTARPLRHRTPLARVQSSRDITILGSNEMRDRHDSEALQAAIQAKIDAAARRRAALLPEPRNSLITPVSITMKTPPGWTPRPKDWKDKWSMNSYREVVTGDCQVNSVMAANQARARLQFQADLANAAAEAQACRIREAAAAAALEEKRRLHTQKLDRAVAQAEANYARRQATLEERHKQKHDRSESFLNSRNKEMRASLEAHHERLVSRSMATQERHERYSRNRAMQKQYHSDNHESKRMLAAQNLNLRKNNFEAKVNQQQQHEMQVHERAAAQDEQYRQHFQDRFHRVNTAILQANKTREGRLMSSSLELGGRNNARFAKFQHNDEAIKRCQSAQQEAIHQKHAQMSAQNRSRYEAGQAREKNIQQKHTSALITRHWAQELALKATIDNRLGTPRQDVQQTLNKIKVKA